MSASLRLLYTNEYVMKKVRLQSYLFFVPRQTFKSTQQWLFHAVTVALALFQTFAKQPEKIIIFLKIFSRSKLQTFAKSVKSMLII